MHLHTEYTAGIQGSDEFLEHVPISTRESRCPAHFCACQRLFGFKMPTLYFWVQDPEGLIDNIAIPPAV